MTTSHDGIILFAHGSRDPLWHRPIEAVAQRIRARAPQALVQCAYLELSTPDLSTAAQTLITQGAQRLRIVPLFLGMGKHAREDLPQLVQALREQYPAIEWELTPAAGENEQLLDTLCAIALAPASITAKP
ncbi:CbiX/SirB N-terminal domain-containing protein [Curvibacter sp. APW13]|uniref:sirohydrochlorin chelatase n=1 Tax=Curvibacter sp. APW13 TaxID=3077236 RepID=UPI0028E06D0D|nr:CbiX/SirB N-terminal domain-containing protein [Curvibacter sp. APW13]MDT8991351.1 CbiX/SirB N-terminal domain-containing protein [Curvibacter sp. APW13]